MKKKKARRREINAAANLLDDSDGRNFNMIIGATSTPTDTVVTLARVAQHRFGVLDIQVIEAVYLRPSAKGMPMVHGGDVFTNALHGT